MKADVSNEQRFIFEADAFEFIAQDVKPILHALDDWLSKVEFDLQVNRLSGSGLKEQSSLTRLADAINVVLSDGMQARAQHWIHLEAARALADTLDDKIVFLVFGKFNAGKSSFCNFLADRFAAHGKSVQYFHLDAGRIVESPDRFTEGVTETTTRLQGVRLGERLVLLDTPGLHSVTPDNAALTQRFTDSADAVLWLTSSTSPGQVQELDELGRELRRNKALLPIVTRSDQYEEDEVDGEIRKCLCNKTAQNRALQEADVRARAEQKLVEMHVDTALLKRPVSISAYVAREQGQSPMAMIEAGFERLYASLLAISGPALAYKRRKRAEVLLHHLEENVLARVFNEVMPLLAGLNTSAQAALDAVEQQRDQIVNLAWRSVMSAVPALLERHSATHDVQATCNELSQSVSEAFAREANEQLADYVIASEISSVRIELDEDVGFEDIVVEAPGSAGNLRQVVGVDYQRLYVSLEQEIRRNLIRLSSEVAEKCRTSIRHLMALAAQLEDSLQAHEHDLLALKREWRAAPMQLNLPSRV
jgi:predicted GTPase